MSIELDQPDAGDAQDCADLAFIYDADPAARQQLPGQISVGALLASTTLQPYAIRFNSRLVATACVWRKGPATLCVGAIAVRPSSRGRELPERLVRNILRREGAGCRHLEIACPATPEGEFAPELQGFARSGEQGGVLHYTRST